MPTSSFFKFEAFIEAVHHKKHDFSTDVFKVVFSNAANAPVAGDAVLADLTTVSAANLVSAIIAVTSSGQTGGTYKLVLTDKTLQASGGGVGPFQYITIYNDTATNKDLVGRLDYGADITIGDGESLLLDFDDANGYFDAV